MIVSKYNLFINKNFDTYTFSDNKDISIFKTIDNNFLKNTIYLVHSNKPESSKISLNVAIDSIIDVYLYPTMNTNITFSINEMLHTVDNAIFIITNHIEENKFGIKLVYCENGVDYDLYNNYPALLYNNSIEKVQYELNTNKDLLVSQKENYTSILNNESKLSNFINSNINITTDYTNSYTINFSFSDITNYNRIISIIDKFYFNMQIYDYNDFKYIYQQDISISDNNYSLSDTNYITGILKNIYTKIIPHTSIKLKKGENYSYNGTIVNKYTSYEKDYSNQKILVLFQLSINNKNEIYDISNNIESDSIYIIT